LVFAPSCVVCRGPIPTRSDGRSVCVVCWSRARSLPLPRCPRCWLPLRRTRPEIEPACGACPDLRPAIRAVRSAYLLEGPVRALVHALKYRGWYTLARPMGRRMAALDLPRELRLEPPVVVPVPLARVRQRQ